MTAPVWRLSTRDDLVHAWPVEQDETVDWKASCAYVTPRSHIADHDQGDKCFACILIEGTAMADRTGANRWTS